MQVPSALRHLDRRPVQGLLLALAGTGHLLYPAYLHLRTRRLPDETPPPVGAPVPLTVVVPAYREASVIAAKIGDLRANGYGGRLDVIVVADDAETAAAALWPVASIGSSSNTVASSTFFGRRE